MSPNGSLLRHPRQEWRGSPNYGARPTGEVSGVVLHADASSSVAGTVAWCQTPKPKNPNPVSYHCVVGRTGVIYGLVEPQNRAWHAGASACWGRTNLNDFTVGVCLSNRMDGREPYTDAALDAAAYYCAALMQAFPLITFSRYVTHQLCATPPGRKKDPGSLFDFHDFLARVAACRDAMGSAPIHTEDA